MSDKEKDDKDQPVILSGRMLPPYIWEEQPGIDPQKKRAHQLKHRHLTPLDFKNVLFAGFVKFCGSYLVCLLIKTFLSDLIAAYFWEIFAVLAVIIFCYVLYAQTIVKNAPDLKEELFFNGVVNVICFIGGLVVAVR